MGSYVTIYGVEKWFMEEFLKRQKTDSFFREHVSLLDCVERFIDDDYSLKLEINSKSLSIDVLQQFKGDSQAICVDEDGDAYAWIIPQESISKIKGLEPSYYPNLATLQNVAESQMYDIVMFYG